MRGGRRRSPALIFLLLLLPTDVRSATFTITNNCLETIWPGLLSNIGTGQLPTTGFRLSKEESREIEPPAGWSGRIWGRTRCSLDGSGQFRCLSGDCRSGRVECSGGGPADPATLVDFALNWREGLDLYDVSLADGFNLPVLVAPQGRAAGGCAATGCLTDVNRICPSELRVAAAEGDEVIACRSACQAFRTPRYCCDGAYGNPRACTPTTYSLIFSDACPRAYSYSYDHSPNSFTCAAANYLITFCPSSSRIGAADLSGYAPPRDLENRQSIVFFVYIMAIVIMMILLYTWMKIFQQRSSSAEKQIPPPHDELESGNLDSNSSDIVHDDCKWSGDKVGGWLMSIGIACFGIVVRQTDMQLGWLLACYLSSFLFYTLGFLIKFFMMAKILQDAKPNSHSSQLPAESDSHPVSNYIVPKSCKWLFEQAVYTTAMGTGLYVISQYTTIAQPTVSAPLLVICGIAMFFMMATEFWNAKRTENTDVSSDIVPKCYVLALDVGKIVFGSGMCFLFLQQVMICVSVIVLALLLVISGLWTVAWILWISLHDAESPNDAKIAKKVAAGIVLAVLFASAIARVVEIVSASG